ncbi:hypothetical protein CPLU01_12775 [Colletotrichum plurivorum]|uniref:Uncharacterized protein n=1 Tax=Colletotrichum plurivorum TaxID=2175906 RepID=A0A8H6N5M8_9PEZI|nr:hypothetical protein CPLU01_12775 [Colletotrichum plurivorum]
MLSTILSAALAANLVSAAGLQPRQSAALSSDAAAFSSAADALISAYIPAPQWEALTSAVGSAASAAGVTQDVKDAVYSALKATEAPEWFANVVPTAYSSQFAALESAIDSIRPTITVTVPGPVPTVVAVTTTDADGNTIITSVSTTLTPVPTTITTDLLPTPSVSVSVVTGTNSDGSAFTSTVLASDASETAATTATDTVTTDASATDGATVTEPGDATATGATGTGTDAPSETNAATPAAKANGLAGLAAVFGLFMAL